jgi:excinuclease ABC subunit B
MGRASRNVGGKVILYADRESDAMRQAIGEVNRRRKIQQAYNNEHDITPETIIKSSRAQIIEKPAEVEVEPLVKIDISSLTHNQRKSHISKLKKEMRNYASALDFESAIKLRDKIREIENL